MEILNIYDEINQYIKDKSYDINTIYKSNKDNKYIFTLYDANNPDVELVDNIYSYDSKNKKIKGYTLVENPSELDYAAKHIVYNRR